MSQQRTYGTVNASRQGYASDEDVSETTKLLTNSLYLAQRAEDLQVATFKEVLEQGDTLRAAQGHVSELNAMSAEAQQSIQKIRMRLYRKKCCLWFTIGFLAFMNVLLMTILWRNNGSFYPQHH